MAKQPVIKIDDIKNIAEIMTKSEINEVENSFVREAMKAKETQVDKSGEQPKSSLVVEEIQVNDGSKELDADKDEER